MDFIEYCSQNKILLCVFAPHSIHTLQPVDVSLFRLLSSIYSRELDIRNFQAQGLLPMKTGEFFPIFWKSWQLAFTEENILSSFRATGISPFNRDVVVNRFTKQPPEPADSRENSVSNVDGDDWRTADRLLLSLVADRDSDDFKKFRQCLHHLSIQNELLREENRGLKLALRTKKRHKKKSKPLDLQQRQEYHGGAVVYSPRKVNEARWRERVLQEQKLDEERAKAEAKELEKAAKLCEEKMREERKLQRQRNKEAKEKEAAEKRAAKQAEKAACDAAKAIQLSQKRKRNSTLR